ncbi:LITAF domain-containing protein-like [Macrosteles quadrilineatus]|uniref:LITAF domain-containing protein-like n=1 Tax=Macrosteles quadrilineatus TaxID=74068 RepID=UPI0023E19A33|nr:LITAF domain-containing protein-like [Macrosteles quadrilineatus]
MAGKSAGTIPAYHGPPPAAPPSYSQAVGGVPPSSPFTPSQPVKHRGFMETQAQGPVIMTTVVPVGSQPTHMICPHCYSEITTKTKTEPGLIAYISGTLIALFGFICGCCLIPCCIDSCMNVIHSCPNCNTYLGRYQR